MISHAAACRCAWSRKTPSASWWRDNELDYLGADPGRAVEGAGEHRLSDVVLGLRGGRGRVGVVAGREHDARQGARHRVDLRRRDSRVQEFRMKPFLPFTRPSIDEESIAAV